MHILWSLCNLNVLMLFLYDIFYFHSANGNGTEWVGGWGVTRHTVRCVYMNGCVCMFNIKLNKIKMKIKLIAPDRNGRGLLFDMVGRILNHNK